ncbi:MAG: PAS domain S-box protein, partial [Verrucomicrobia bacterium]|nr:PAS domain S-box protein [Verrucomicrobiota bacterium]
RLYESMRDAFVSVDMAGNLREFNQAYAQMLGYSDEELHRLTYMDLTPKKWHAFEASLVREQILKRGYSDVYEKEYQKKDGTVFPVELRTFLITDPGGEPVGMWAIVRDISERKATEGSQREFSRRLWLAQDAAQRRIARELHDSTAQDLAAAAMNLTLLKDEMSGNKAMKLLHDSLALVQECTQQVSTLSYLLHPPLLDDLGLIPALRSYVQGFAQRSGIQVMMDLPKDLGRLPQEVELTLFRVVQEGLGNERLWPWHSRVDAAGVPARPRRLGGGAGRHEGTSWPAHGPAGNRVQPARHDSPGGSAAGPGASLALEILMRRLG